jgi:hypothetical protein
MSKLRSVSTSFWSDPFVEDLTPSEKLLYLYLITNERTNMLGVYELSLKKMAFETGLDKATVDKSLKKFSTLKKVVYTSNHVFLINFAKHQNYNTNMKKSAIDVYLNLPEHLKIKGLDIDKSNPSKGFESLLKGLGMVRKVEVEVEDEREYETEKETESRSGKGKRFKPPTLDEVIQYCKERENNVNPERFIDYYTSNGWMVGKNEMKNWKAAVRTWENNNYDQPFDTKPDISKIDWGNLDEIE